MKKKYLLPFAITFCIAALCACTNTESEESALEKVESYDDTVDTSQYVYQDDIADWLTPEDKYYYTADYDNSENIDTLENNYIVRGDRLYFQVSRDGDSLWAYMSLITGEKLYLCPDPLCPHTKESGCMYLNITNLIFAPGSDSVMYVIRTNSTADGLYDAIYLIDTENDIFREIYKENVEKYKYNQYTLRFILNNKLYFQNTQTISEIVDGKVEKKTNYIMLTLDLDTNNVEKISESSQASDRCLLANDQYMFFDDDEYHQLYATDLNSKNKQTIMEYDDEFTIRNVYFDKTTQELFFILCSKYMVGISHNDIEEGYVYCIDKNLNCSKIDMPTEKITGIQLTRNYIYYTTYDPIYYGVSPRGIDCIDETGNKIYRVSRSGTTASEPVFDGHEKIFFDINYKGYIVTGNYIYIAYVILHEEGGMIWFRSMGSTARINFKDETIKWLNLD